MIKMTSSDEQHSPVLNVIFIEVKQELIERPLAPKRSL